MNCRQPRCPLRLEFLESLRSGRICQDFFTAVATALNKGDFDSSSQIDFCSAYSVRATQMRNWQIWLWSLMALRVFLPKRNTWSVSLHRKGVEIVIGPCQPKSLSSSLSWWQSLSGQRGFSEAKVAETIRSSLTCPICGSEDAFGRISKAGESLWLFWSLLLKLVRQTSPQLQIWGYYEPERRAGYLAKSIRRVLMVYAIRIFVCFWEMWKPTSFNSRPFDQCEFPLSGGGASQWPQHPLVQFIESLGGSKHYNFQLEDLL